MKAASSDNTWLWIIFGLSLAIAAYLIPLASQGAFFSGDMGLKYLQTQTFIERGPAFDLKLAVPEYAQKLYSEGYYPFGPPFVFELEGTHFSQYPPLFPLLSVFGLQYFGLTGLYLFPLLSLCGLWLAFLWLCGQSELSGGAKLAACAALALCSPLTLYAATFWEHLPALAFWLWGLALAAYSGQAFAAGILLGLAVFLRPEFAVCGPLALFAAGALRGSRPNGLGAAWLGFALCCAAWLELNQVLYATPLGVHGLQFLHGIAPDGKVLGGGLVNRLSSAFSTWLSILAELLRGFPLAFLVLAGLLAKPDLKAKALILAGLGMLCFTPFVLGPQLEQQKQWGPRFIFALIPLSCLGLGLLYDQLRRGRKAWLALGALLFLYCFYQNSLTGTHYLAWDYANRVLPSLNLIRSLPQSNVSANLQHINQELAVLSGEKFFFLAKDRLALQGLANELAQQGIYEFIYVRHVEHPGYNPGQDTALPGLDFRLLIKHAKYETYLISARPQASGVRNPQSYTAELSRLRSVLLCPVRNPSASG